MQKIVAAALGAAFLCCLEPAASQEPPALQCAPRAEIARSLADAYGEHLRVQAPMDDGRLLEIYVGDDRQTWTALAIVPLVNVGCLVASGTFFEVIAARRNG